VNDSPDRTPAADPRYTEGLRIRREVLGDAHVDRALAGAAGIAAPFQEYVTRTAWGSAWAREELDRRTRSCITLALLTALRCEEELALHVRAAAANGLSPEEVMEVILHTAVYAGVPAANAAVRVAQGVWAD
jgi:4-carboxymuconolactone decarboxylase